MSAWRWWLGSLRSTLVWQISLRKLAKTIMHSSIDSNNAQIVIKKFWVIADLCAFALGVITRLVLNTPSPPNKPIFENVQQTRLSSWLVNLFSNPLAYVIITALFVLYILHRRFKGFWSGFLSFLVGGTLTSLVLMLLSK
jgi:energy-converting hydrogenase Eha subunit A